MNGQGDEKGIVLTEAQKRARRSRSIAIAVSLVILGIERDAVGSDTSLWGIAAPAALALLAAVWVRASALFVVVASKGRPAHSPLYRAPVLASDLAPEPVKVCIL